MSFVFAVLLVSAQAAADSQQAPASTAATPAPKKEKKICKVDEATSGTRMAKRLCLTEEDWAKRSKSMYDSSRSGTTATAQDH